MICNVYAKKFNIEYVFSLLSIGKKKIKSRGKVYILVYVYPNISSLSFDYMLFPPGVSVLKIKISLVTTLPPPPTRTSGRQGAIVQLPLPADPAPGG